MSKAKTCTACRNLGWLLASADNGRLSIQRCDACETFAGDDKANEYVAAMAEFAAEFMADVEAVGVRQVGKGWPDLLITYNKMIAAGRRLRKPKRKEKRASV